MYIILFSSSCKLMIISSFVVYIYISLDIVLLYLTTRTNCCDNDM